MYDVDFPLSVVEALEQKVEIKKGYRGMLSNRELNML
jgi:glutathione synthase